MLSKFNLDQGKSHIKNPFVCGSSKSIRLSLDKHPETKIGNTKYCKQYKNQEGDIILNNELDPRLSYVFSKNEEKKDFTSGKKFDYIIPAEAINKTCKVKHKEGLPLSFLQIKTEEDGIEWYMNNYPKIPKDLLPIIARYHWGEPITKKGLKNEKKKIEKKLQQKGLRIEHKKHIVSFD
jgi:hypothetical protein